MIELSLIQKLIVWILPLIFAITIHEVAHGWVASLLGDKTAKMMGRLTLNPLKHIDMIGTVLLPLVLFLFSPIIFGWAKPVPVTPQNLRNPKRDMAFVAAAGPISNFLMAIIWAILMKLGLVLMAILPMVGLPLVLMGQAGIMINLVLMVLNLIPIPPLDGSRIVSSLLPNRMSYYYNRIEPYGIVILLLLIATRLLNILLWPPIIFLYKLITSIFGLNV